MPPTLVPVAKAVPDDSPAYQRLLRNTDKKNLPSYDQVQRFMKPLEGVIAEEGLRFRAALAQASAASSIAMDGFKTGFLADLDSLFVKLDAEKQAFEAFTEQKVQKEIKGTEAKIADLNQKQATVQDQIARLQASIQDFDTQREGFQSDIHSTQLSINKAVQDFHDAYDRRRSELERQKAEYQTLLT